jgi:hypothetical protein
MRTVKHQIRHYYVASEVWLHVKSTTTDYTRRDVNLGVWFPVHDKTNISSLVCFSIQIPGKL